jgi:hypothetical protein
MVVPVDEQKQQVEMEQVVVVEKEEETKEKELIVTAVSVVPRSATIVPIYAAARPAMCPRADHQKVFAKLQFQLQ